VKGVFFFWFTPTRLDRNTAIKKLRIVILICPKVWHFVIENGY
jgi:hypothetical protein